MREHYSRKKNKKSRAWILYSTAAALAVIAAVSGIAAYFGWTEPHAVNGAGEIIEEPWVVQAGGRDLFLVDSEMDGAEIVAQVKEYYSKGAGELQDVTVEPEISIVKKELQRGEEVPETVEPELAVREVITQNNGDMPALTVTTTENVENTKPIKYKVKYQESDMMYEGEEKVLRKGTSGEKLITRRLTKVNGNVVKKEVIGEEVTKKPVARIIEKGVMAKPEPVTPETQPPTEPAKSPDKDTALSDKKEKGKSGKSASRAKTREEGAEPDRGESGETQTGDSGRADSGNDSSRNDNDKNGSSKDSSSDRKESSGGGSAEPVKKPKPENGANGGAANPTNGSKGRKVVDYACKFIGNPYRYGGNSLTHGTDCSGFVHLVYAHFGISVPRTSGELARCGRPVSYSNVRLGDIICYPGHVGIYIGSGRIVHASTPSSGIKVSPAAYRSIMAVRRVID